MKHFYYYRNLLLVFLICFSTFLVKAQTDICDTAGIHTNPFAPVNLQKPSAKNYFNWMLSPSNHNFTCYQGSSQSFIIVSPWYETSKSNLFIKYANGPNSDFYPQDGWELLKQNLGRLNNDTTPRAINVELPYFMVYNKYTGLMNMFCTLSSQLEMYDYAIANIYQYTPGQNGLNASAVFDAIAPFNQALDQKTYYTGMSLVTVPTNNRNFFFWYQFPVAYDPCVCHHRSTILVDFGFEARGYIFTIGDAEINFSTPGSEFSNLDNEEISSSVLDPFGNLLSEYPAFNEVLGTFALLQTPIIQHFDSTAYETKGGAPIDKDVYMIANPILYAFNPVMHEDTINTKVNVAIYLKYKGNGKLPIHLLKNIGFSQIDTNSDFISTYVPVECATSFISALTHSDDWSVTDNYDIYLKFDIDFVSTDIGRSGKPNQSHLLFTYPVNVEEITNATLTNDPLNFLHPCVIKTHALSHQFVKDYCNDGIKGLSYQAYLLNDTASGTHIIQNSYPTNFDINIYPNPASGSAVLNLKLPVSNEFTMIISDVQGRLLKRCFENKTFEAGISNFVIDISNLSSGVYFCKIFNGSIMQVKKLVVAD